MRKFYENISDIYFLIKLARKFDIIYFLGIEVGLFYFIPKILNKNLELVVNIDGVMWKRTKFNVLERTLLKLNHIFATIFADRIVLDAESMGNYVSESRKHKTVFIPYGVEEIQEIQWDSDRLDALLERNAFVKEIHRNDYWLVVARLEPENNIHLILEGILKSDSQRPLVVVGETTSKKYGEILDQISNKYPSKKVLRVGTIYDKELLNMLRQHCFAYLHGHSVGGTNPSLIEAMSMKNLIIAHENEFNREVCGDVALYFSDASELGEIINLVEDLPEIEINKFKENAFKRALYKYSWDKIVLSYKLLFG